MSRLIASIVFSIHCEYYSKHKSGHVYVFSVPWGLYLGVDSLNDVITLCDELLEPLKLHLYIPSHSVRGERTLALNLI
jgi:hypothetical protein